MKNNTIKKLLLNLSICLFALALAECNKTKKSFTTSNARIQPKTTTSDEDTGNDTPTKAEADRKKEIPQSVQINTTSDEDKKEDEGTTTETIGDSGNDTTQSKQINTPSDKNSGGDTTAETIRDSRENTTAGTDKVYPVLPPQNTEDLEKLVQEVKKNSKIIEDALSISIQGLDNTKNSFKKIKEKPFKNEKKRKDAIRQLVNKTNDKATAYLAKLEEAKVACNTIAAANKKATGRSGRAKYIQKLANEAQGNVAKVKNNYENLLEEIQSMKTYFNNLY